MVNDEVGTKLVRFLYFVGAGVICTSAINAWRDFERKAALQKAVAAETSEKSGTVVANAAVVDS